MAPGSRGVQSLRISLRTEISAAKKAGLARIASFRARIAIEIQLELSLYLIVVFANTVHSNLRITTLTTERRLVKGLQLYANKSQIGR